MRRPKKPKRKPGLRWIYARWREREQRYEWCPAPRVDGKLVWGASHVDQDEAFQAAKDIMARYGVHKSIGETTLRQACELAIRRLLGAGGSEVTAKGYRFRFGRWFEFLSADAPVTALQADDVHYLVEQRRAEHEVGSDCIRTDLVLLQRVLDVAGLKGERNPVRGIEKPSAPIPHRPFFTMAEVADIAARIRASDYEDTECTAVLVLFLAMTGARAWEISRLRQHHVAVTSDGCVVTLHGVKGKRKVARTVRVAKGAADIALAFVRGAIDAPPIEPVKIAVTLRRWARRLNEPRLSARTLRRTFATEVAQHVPIQYVSQFLGHTQLTTTAKYLGTDARLAQVAAEQLHSALAGTPQPQRPAPSQRSDEGSATQGTRATPRDARRESGSSSSESRDPS